MEITPPEVSNVPVEYRYQILHKLVLRELKHQVTIREKTGDFPPWAGPDVFYLSGLVELDRAEVVAGNIERGVQRSLFGV